MPSEPKTPASCGGGSKRASRGSACSRPNDGRYVPHHRPAARAERCSACWLQQRGATEGSRGGTLGKSSAKHTSHREEVILSCQRLNVFIFLSVNIQGVLSHKRLSMESSGLFVCPTLRLTSAHATCSTDWYHYSSSSERSIARSNL